VLLRDLAGGRFMPNNAVAGLYLTLLSRRPTAGETALFRDTLATASNRRDALIDLVWALLNTTEFQCHH
jgi:hypothetical protein